MSERVSMPALGESVTEGTVTRWLKSVGDEVEVDEPLLEVSTDKVDTEIPSPVAGTLQEILAEEDETVEVGADLAVIGDGAAPDASADEGESEDEDSDDSSSDDSGSDDSSDSETSASQDSAESAPQEKADEAQDAADESVREDTATDEDSESGSGAGDGDAGEGDAGEGQTVTMPALGESVTEGTVTRWLKSEGDDVEVDEPLLEVSTDKVDTEIPSPVAGVLTSILVAEDDTVEVGGDLAVIGGSSGGSGKAAQDSGAEKSDDTESDKTESGDAESDDQDSDDGSGDDLASEQQTQDKAAQEAEAKTSAGSDSKPKQEASASKDSAPADDTKASDTKADDTKANDEKAGSAKPGSSASPQQKSQPAGDGERDVSAYVTPLVRKLAAQHDVDLGAVEGTGVGGRIRKQDVLDAAKKASEQPAESEAAPDQGAAGGSPSETKPSAPAPEVAAKRGQTEKMSRLRKVIATRMVESLQISAQLTTVVEVDVTKVSRVRASHKQEFQEREGVKLSFMPFFALAAVEALKQHPSVNASIDGDQVIYHAQENLGVAVDTERGLLVPVIKDAGDLNIAGLARKIADLAERTRTNKIGPDELGGGTFTLTNTGSRGALFDTPILNQPQVAILGTGSVVRRPVVVIDAEGGETIAIRSMIYLALTYDHRLVDGADAARFLETVKRRLEEASFEV